MSKLRKTQQAHAEHSTSAMAPTMRRNGASPKSQMSRGNDSIKNYELRIMSSVAAMLLGVAGVFAQDIITLKSGDDIEALVEKVGETEIEYKRWDNQTGPTYVVKSDKIFMINYRNGTKQVFNTPAKPSQPQAEQVQQPVTPVTPLTPQTSPTPVTPSSSNLRTEFYGISNSKSMLDFFRRNNFTNYYNRFNAACKAKTAADACLVVGIAFAGGGVILHVSGNKMAKDAANASSLSDALAKAQTASVLMDTGTTFIVMGAVSVVGSIVVYSIAGSRKKTIKNDFAQEHFGVTGYAYQPKLNFGTTANGIGLTLNF